MKNFLVLFALLALVSCGTKDSTPTKLEKKGSYYNLTIDSLIGSNQLDGNPFYNTRVAFLQIHENPELKNVVVNQDVYNCLYITGGHWVATGLESGDLCFHGDINKFVYQANLVKLPHSNVMRFELNNKAIPELYIVYYDQILSSILLIVFDGFYSKTFDCNMHGTLEESPCFLANPNFTTEIWQSLGL